MTPSDKLTPREREVVDLLGTGLAQKQIARRLGISYPTTRAHIHNAMGKVGAKSATHLAVIAATKQIAG